MPATPRTRRKAPTQQQTLQRLRQNLQQLPEPELVQPWYTEPPVPAITAAQRTPPPGGWRDDEGWEEEARVLQGLSGEDSQCG